MRPRNPQLTAIALLVQKFGTPISGGYEVRVTALELTEMSPTGMFQEVPDIDGKGVRWQYFPSTVIDLKPEDFVSVPESDALVRRAKYTREEVAAMNVSEDEAQRLLRENAE